MDPSNSWETSDFDDEDAVVVPPLPLTIVNGGQCSRKVQRDLFPEVHTTVYVINPYENAEPLCSTGEEVGSGMGSMIYCSRFQEALHLMLTDGQVELALFGRDAPPVWNNTGVHGKW